MLAAARPRREAELVAAALFDAPDDTPVAPFEDRLR
jgi:hypothetical protein